MRNKLLAYLGLEDMGVITAQAYAPDIPAEKNEEIRRFGASLLSLMKAVKIHPYYQEQEVVPFIQEKGIVVQCWYPLGGRGYSNPS